MVRQAHHPEQRRRVNLKFQSVPLGTRMRLTFAKADWITEEIGLKRVAMNAKIVIVLWMNCLREFIESLKSYLFALC
jgi:hypothetical protein